MVVAVVVGCKWVVGEVEWEAIASIADAIQVGLWRVSWREVHGIELGEGEVVNA